MLQWPVERCYVTHRLRRFSGRKLRWHGEAHSYYNRGARARYIRTGGVCAEGIPGPLAFGSFWPHRCAECENYFASSAECENYSASSLVLLIWQTFPSHCSMCEGANLIHDFPAVFSKMFVQYKWLCAGISQLFATNIILVDSLSARAIKQRITFRVRERFASVPSV